MGDDGDGDENGEGGDWMEREEGEGQYLARSGFWYTRLGQCRDMQLYTPACEGVRYFEKEKKKIFFLESPGEECERIQKGKKGSRYFSPTVTDAHLQASLPPQAR